MSGYYIAAAAFMFLTVLYGIGRPNEVKAYTLMPWVRIGIVMLDAAILALLVIGAVHL